ncbi:MAG: CaiB/BaiF CoA transferase family protein [Lautropia sp.]
MTKPLDGILVVALEHAVAAPYCSSRLADAGARVIKIERPDGDFARGYDAAVFGEASYFVWINRGKESLALDLKQPADRDRLSAIVATADVFLQNLAPGAAERLGFGSDALRARHPRLVTCDLSGYGERGPLKDLKAYDLLVQAESGLVAVSGTEGPWGRIGVSLCDITTGMNALIGIQQALMLREKTGKGSGIKVSLFDSAAELMAVPYLQTRYGGTPPRRIGLAHPSVAPYGVFRCADGRELVLSIQNEREWLSFCRAFLQRETVATDPRFSDNNRRVANRAALDALIQSVFDGLDAEQAVARLAAAQTAYGAINSVADLIAHPQLRTTPMPVGGEVALMPAIPFISEWEDAAFRPVPAIDQHGDLPGR